MGSVARYGVGIAAGKLLGKGFPWGTLIVNVAGCFLMGIVVQLLLSWESRAALAPGLRAQTAYWHRGIAIGFLGGLTTFSSFGADTLREFSAQRPAIALANIAANVLLSLAAVWCGMQLVQAAD